MIVAYELLIDVLGATRAEIVVVKSDVGVTENVDELMIVV